MPMASPIAHAMAAFFLIGGNVPYAEKVTRDDSDVTFADLLDMIPGVGDADADGKLEIELLKAEVPAHFWRLLKKRVNRYCQASYADHKYLGKDRPPLEPWFMQGPWGVDKPFEYTKHDGTVVTRIVVSTPWLNTETKKLDEGPAGKISLPGA